MLVMTDGFASRFCTGWLLAPNGYAAAVGAMGLLGAETVLSQAWICFSGGTQPRAGTSGGWLDEGLLAVYFFLVIGIGWRS